MDKYLTTCIERIKFSHDGFDAACSNGNSYLAKFNVCQMLKWNIMRILIMWRHSRDPEDEIISTLQNLNEMLCRVEILDDTQNIFNDIPVSKILILASLISRWDYDFLIRYHELSLARNDLDAIIAEFLRSSIFHEEKYHETIATIESKKSLSLFIDGYKGYGEIILNHDHNEVDLSVARFGKRSTNRFYVNGDQTEGGGKENDLIVDYRLGAILKKIEYNEKNPHVWKWQ